MRKAQVAYEFIMIFFVLSIAFITWLAISSSFQAELQKSKNLEDFEDFALSLKHDIFVVAQMSDGFSKSLNLPLTINGRVYDISVTNFTNQPLDFSFSTVEINSSEIGYFTHFNVPLMNQSLVKGDNILIKEGDKILVKN
jgi:hypothetical protein